MNYNFSREWSTDVLEEIPSAVSNFKKQVWELFGPHCDKRLNTLNFHLLDHFVHALERFGTIRVLIASPYEHFNYIVKQAYDGSQNGCRQAQWILVNVLIQTWKDRRFLPCSLRSPPKSQSSKRQCLVRSGNRINPQCLFSFGEDPKDNSFDSFPFLHRLINYFAFDEIPIFISLLLEEHTCMDLPMLTSLAYVTVYQ